MTIKEQIEREGQAYYDRPIMARPKQNGRIESAISDAFGNRPALPIQIGHERIRLNWIKPPRP